MIPAAHVPPATPFTLAPGYDYKTWLPLQESNPRTRGFHTRVSPEEAITWCHELDLNQPHTDFQSAALPDELPRHFIVESARIAHTLLNSHGWSVTIAETH